LELLIILKQNQTAHTANTAHVKDIDFAAQHGFDGVLVDWNQGWEDWLVMPKIMF
jgi:hypothetical protein